MKGRPQPSPQMKKGYRLYVDPAAITDKAKVRALLTQALMRLILAQSHRRVAMKPTIARIYQREFKPPADAEAFIEATHLIEGRISAVDMSYRLYQSDENPVILLRFGNILMRKSMEWVPQWKGRLRYHAGLTLKQN